MQVRKVTPEDDFEAIGNVYVQSWKTAYKGMIPQSYLDELTGSGWVHMLTNGSYDHFVVMDGANYAGTSAICPAREAAMAGWGEMVSLYLLPAYFGKGYAQPLFDCALSALVQQGFAHSYLWVLAQNERAQRFYEKNGFQKNGDADTITIAGKELVEVRYTFGNQ